MTDTPFHDLREFIALPRLAGLALSPDGSRLVTSVGSPNPAGTTYVNALWQIDPAGELPARRLTRGAAGERNPEFTPDGDLLFVAARPDPAQAEQKDDAPAALWLLPAGGGEARVVGTRPGGFDGVSVARDAGTVLAVSKTLPTSVTAEDDEERRAARKEKAVTAILHSGHPIRFWDHDIGPDLPRLLTGTLPVGGHTEDTVDWTDLTPTAGMALDELSAELTPDGSAVVSTWVLNEPHGDHRSTLVRIDAATGERSTIADEPDVSFTAVRISPDGDTVAAVRFTHSTPQRPPRLELVVLPVAGGAPRAVLDDRASWPGDLRWTPDGTALIVTADENGRAPVFRVPLDGGEVIRLTGDDGAYSSPAVSPDGAHVYALRSAVDAAPAPVRLDAHTAQQQPTFLPSPAEAAALPGTLAEVTATAADGTPLRSWLALPHDAADTPAPLVLWVHGGPLSSWNCWHWRWNPWLLVAKGYAVLLPDPALSTGYGQEFLQRGWGTWGDAPYTDVLALTDAAEQRSDVDETRTAAMGGSFGGYMANWIAGHTDRFGAIVTHASLWSLDAFGPTTDGPAFWRKEITDEMAQVYSPHRFADEIRTPMLVIHGDRDYRVPIGEALRLWWDLMSRQEDPEKQPHRFLYFPTENHWVLAPQHAIVWYETVLAFLDHHLRGIEFTVPDVLR